LLPKEKHITVSRTARYFTLGELSQSTKDIWIVLHGHRQLAGDFINIFNELAVEGSFIIAPEGLMRLYIKGDYGDVGASWMTKEDRESDINDYVKYLDKLYNIPGFGVFRYITFRSGAAAVTALVIAFWLGPKIIRKLRERQIGEAAKLEAPKTHLSKAGTPTMGGLIVLFSIVVPALLWADITNMYIVLILFVTMALGAVGFLDDYLKVVKKKPKGLIGRYKIVGQVVVGLVVGGIIYFHPEWFDPTLVPVSSKTTVPFFKNLEFDFGVLYIPMVIFVITATSNAVNLTDGLDGLAIGTVGIVGATIAPLVSKPRAYATM